MVLILLLAGILVRVNVVDSSLRHIKDAEIVIKSDGEVKRVGEGDFVALPHPLNIFYISAPGWHSIQDTLYLTKDTTLTFILTPIEYKTEEVEVISSPLPSGDVKIKRESIIETPSPIAPDPLRPILNLPFVEPGNELLPFSFYVKGAVPGENSAFIEGYPLVFPFHFGFTTAVPVYSLKSYDFYTVYIPPELSLKVSSAINFHLRNDRTDELFVDPTSSINFVHSRKDFLASIRFTSMSLPVYLMTKNILYYFGDVIGRFRNFISYISYDFARDSVTDMIEWDFLNFMSGMRIGECRVYFSSGIYHLKYLDTGEKDASSSESFGIVGKAPFSLGFHFRFLKIDANSKYFPWMNGSYRVFEGQIWRGMKFGGFRITPMFKIIKNGRWKIDLMPQFGFGYLWRRYYLRITSGANSQVESSPNSGWLGVANKMTKNYYLQAESGGEKVTFGGFVRYYPHEYYIAELARVDTVISSSDTLWNLIPYDSLFHVRKFAAGAYVSFSFGKQFWRLSGDVGILKGFESTGKTKFPLPYTPEISIKLMPSLRWGKNVIDVPIYFKSGIKIPEFYGDTDIGPIVYEKPRTINSKVYLRVDVSWAHRFHFLGSESRFVLGIFNLIGIKPDIGFEPGEDKFVRIPIPSAGVWIKFTKNY